MGKKDDTAHRARYTLEFKLEAVRLVKGGQNVGVTAKATNGQRSQRQLTGGGSNDSASEIELAWW